METPVQSVSSDAPFSIDFGALRQQASDLLDKAEATRSASAPEPPAAPVEPVATSPVVAESATPAEPSGQAAAPASADPTEPKAFEVPDDALVKIIVDGEEQLIPYKEAKAGFSRTQKFTQSMQQLAKERTEFNDMKAQQDQLRQERDQLATLVNNRPLLLNYLRATEPALFAQQQQPPVAGQSQAFDPNEIATVGQAQQLAQQQAVAIEQRLQQIQQATNEQIQQATAELRHQEQVAKHSSAISTTLADIFSKNPVLRAVPNAEDVIRYEVAKMNPQTEADALDAFRTVAQGITEELGKHYTATKKIQAASQAKARLESRTIEPSGGSAPQLQPANFKNADGSVNWKAVTQMAKDYQG